MKITYDQINRLDNKVLAKMVSVLESNFVPVINWIDELVDEYSKTNPQELYLLNLEFDDDILAIELILFEGDWYFIDFEKNPSTDDKLDFINYGETITDKKVLTDLKFQREPENLICKVSSNLIKNKFIKYEI